MSCCLYPLKISFQVDTSIEVNGENIKKRIQSQSLYRYYIIHNFK